MDVAWEEQGWERLGEGVGRRRLPVWDATVGLVVGERGALLFDTGSTLREGAGVRREAETLLGGGRGVTHIALSHPHFDHVLGTAAFPRAEVYAAAGPGLPPGPDRDALCEDAVRHGVERGEAAEAAAALRRPDREVAGELTLDLGGRTVVLCDVGPGHTARDLVLLVAGPDPVVFCGDLVEESGPPQAGPDAVPARWPDALDRLLRLGGGEAVYVPGHGAAVDAAFVRAQRGELAARFGVS
ncbi:MBL fold metallo-hydrolase [Streptomyces sp. NPDC048001]|uniref:MBL fold metallo-hydrolase n=1 Tax=Streptomyces sp. NPDC048001 TaxID=3365498 RepID=UPI00371B55F4